MEDMDELDIPAAGMYKWRRGISRLKRSLGGGDLGERPGRLGRDSDSGSGPGSAKVGAG